HSARPGLLQLLELEGWRLGCGGRGRRLGRLWRDRGRHLDRLGRHRAHMAALLLELLEPEGERLARQVGARPRHLHERELERQPRIAALAHVLDGDRQEVAEAQHDGLAELVRLRPQALPGLFSQRSRSGSRGRWNWKVWQRERTVASTFERSVVQKTKRRCGGGSSISFRSAFHAASVSWCASSRMYTLYRPSAG